MKHCWSKDSTLWSICTKLRISSPLPLCSPLHSFLPELTGSRLAPLSVSRQPPVTLWTLVFELNQPFFCGQILYFQHWHYLAFMFWGIVIIECHRFHNRYLHIPIMIKSKYNNLRMICQWRWMFGFHHAWIEIPRCHLGHSLKENCPSWRFSASHYVSSNYLKLVNEEYNEVS